MKASWIKYAVVFLLAFASGTTLMVISHRVQSVQGHIARVESSIVQEKEAIRILAAEWSFLNNPERLEKLASAYLHLIPAPPEQLVSNLDAARPVLVEEDVMAAEGNAKIYEVAFAPTPISAVVSSPKPKMIKAGDIKR